jgi:hypothetical protein
MGTLIIDAFLMQSRYEATPMLSEKYKRAQILREKVAQKREAPLPPPPAKAEEAKPVDFTLNRNVQENDTEPEPKRVQETVEPLFAPYELKESSSFNPKKLSQSELNRLDPMTRAKYLAYAQPSAEIQMKITASELRSRKLLKEEHRRVQKLVMDAKKKYDLLHRAIEDPHKHELGLKLAGLAKERILMKQNMIRKARVQVFNVGRRLAIPN